MKVRADLSNLDVTVRNSGLVLNIADESDQPQGRLRIGQATVEWCPVNGKMGHGHKLSVKKFIELLESVPRD